MSYELEFLEPALKEWRKLDNDVRQQFKKKLAERCQNPHVPSAKLHGSANRYKIKLRTRGYRLIYEVLAKEIVVLVIAVGRRDRSEVYKLASRRFR
ncbi:MAG: type II toxin-antitoxin system RelE family toxin [Rhizobiaceae bacterium]|jgi:mRNA interferase RelE/StbE